MKKDYTNYLVAAVMLLFPVVMYMIYYLANPQLL